MRVQQRRDPMKGLALISSLSLIAAAAPADHRTPPAATTFHWRSITMDRRFQPVAQHFQRLIDDQARTRVNHLCVIGQKQPGAYANAYVYWKEANRLILWEPNGDTVDDLIMSRRILDLRTDVVDEAYSGGSTYRVTRSWAGSVIRACRRHGQTMTITRGA